MEGCSNDRFEGTILALLKQKYWGKSQILQQDSQYPLFMIWDNYTSIIYFYKKNWTICGAVWDSKLVYFCNKLPQCCNTISSIITQWHVNQYDWVSITQDVKRMRTPGINYVQKSNKKETKFGFLNSAHACFLYVISSNCRF